MSIGIGYQVKDAAGGVSKVSFFKWFHWQPMDVKISVDQLYEVIPAPKGTVAVFLPETDL